MLDEFGGQLIVAEHHEYDQYEIPWTQVRSDFYWAGNIPHVRIDGLYLDVGASSCYAAAAEYRALIEQRFAETGGQSPVAVTGGYWFDGDSLRVAASFRLLDPAPMVDLQAHVMILEDDLYSSGQAFHHVTRAAGSADVALEVAGQAAAVETAFPVDPAWNPNHLSCAVCLQRMGAVNEEKEIHQAALLGEGHADVPGPAAPVAGLRISARPNPFVPAQHGGRLRVDVRFVPGPVSGASRSSGPWFEGPLELYDAAGRCVARTSPLAAGGEGRVLTATWDGCTLTGRPLEGGRYWLRMPSAPDAFGVDPWAESGAGSGAPRPAPAERFLLLR